MKKCTLCDEVKPLDDFHRHPAMRDGRINQCKTCRHAYAAAWNKANRARCASATRRWRLRNPEKVRAWWTVRHAIEQGRITRPNACEQCGAEQLLHAHHDDYAKPLAIDWLCVPCHERRHHDD